MKIVKVEEVKLEQKEPKEPMDAFNIFLFVNPKSGSRKGQKLLEHEFRAINFALSNGKVGRMNIIDITDAERKESGYIEMQRQLMRVPETKTRIIFAIACGDGTILTLLDEASTKWDIDLNSLQICVLPFGTGNDFAIIMGWGPQP